jgi:outer membrane protein OmpA-like peptidoglycan-associated protein
MGMKKTAMSRALVVLALAAPLLAAHAQGAPVVKSGRILEALTRKDVAIDDGTTRGATQRAHASIDLQVQFAFDSADLLPAGRRQLDELGTALSDRTLQDETFEIAGHTDSVGDRAYNIRLSLERAVAVKHYLVTQYGVSPVRLKAVGLGSSQPVDRFQPTAQVNRRVEVRRLASGGARPASTAPASGGRLIPTP